MSADFHVEDGRCEHGSLTMGCLYCQVQLQRDNKTPEADIYRRIEDLERTRAVDAARVAVLEAEGNVNRKTILGLESRISVLEAEILEMRTGR